jgi:hypothetical protein
MKPQYRNYWDFRSTHCWQLLHRGRKASIQQCLNRCFIYVLDALDECHEGQIQELIDTTVLFVDDCNQSKKVAEFLTTSRPCFSMFKTTQRTFLPEVALHIAKFEQTRIARVED